MLRKVEKEQLKVPAHIDYLGDLRDFVKQVGKRHGFSDKIINAFKLSIDEAATNIIRHAYRDQDGLITVRAIVKKSSLTICIIDQGTFFDPNRVKDPDLNRYIDIGKKGGLGIFIMRKLMDEIDYRRTEEGNELRITKYRDTQQTSKRPASVVSLPRSIKVKFFIRTLIIVTLIIALGYLYYYFRAHDHVITDFINSARFTHTQILNRISSAPSSGFEFIEDIVHPIYENYKEQVYQLSIEDSTGVIVYSTNLGDLFGKFSRPDNYETVERSIYKYKMGNDVEVFELENDIVIKSSGRRYGKAHTFFSTADASKQISAIRFNDLRLAMIILGLSYVGVTLLIYIVLNPLRKLSIWIKDLGHGEINDEIDIDSSSEIGEIAQAFSDITQKFRESQKNLVDQERLQKEMQLAQDIQQTLLPMEFPELEGYEIASYYEAAKEVGGDYYDFVEVDKDTLGIAVADVSGKGVPGSLVMTMIRTALRTEARGMKDAAEVLARVNDFVSNDIKKGMFVTVFYVIIDSKKRQINYASAGHNPMIMYRPSTQKTYYLNPKGFPIGIQLPEKDLFRKSIQSETILLTKDDILVMYTDGITEAMNPQRELFGEERLLELLRKNAQLQIKEFVERLKVGIYSFTEGSAQYDDITLVSIKEKSTREEDELRRAKQAHKLIGEGKSIREACEEVNLTTYAYYNKYKKVFEEEGIDAFEITEEVSVEANHLSIEEKTKIFDIIAKHPEYGAGRISEELNTEMYGFERISEGKIYEELVRCRLNTKILREAFVNKGKTSRRRLKPPGTPLMTLDGRVIIARKDEADYFIEKPVAQPHEPDSPRKHPGEALEKFDLDAEATSLLDVPIDELLSKNHSQEDDIIIESAESASDASPEPSIEGNDTIKTDEPDSSLLEVFEAVTAQKGTFDSEDLNAPSQTEDSSDLSFMDDFSFQNYFSDAGNSQDDDFDDEEADEADQAKKLKYRQKEDFPTASAAEKNVVKADNDDFDESLMVSSVSELLSDTSNNESDEESITPVTDDMLASSVQGDEQNSDADSISFTDLIGSIDKEILYASEPTQAKPPESPNTRKRTIDNNVRAAPRSEPRIPPLTDREKILVKGIRFYKNKEYDNAIQEFKKVLKRYPDYKEAHSILGNAYFRNQMYIEAAMAYEKVKQLDPEDITAYENLGVIYANRGEYKMAVNEWKRVLELSPQRVDIIEKIKKAQRMIQVS